MSESVRDHVDSYTIDRICPAPRERVFDAVATMRGLRGWWTPIVTGTPASGGELQFGFEGLDELIVMRVDTMTRPSQVHWTCLLHTGAPDWVGTTVTFDLLDAGDPNACVLSFGHVGVPAGNVAPGWERFLTSLTRLVETGAGEPYGSATDALHAARTYHDAWTSRDFDAARHCLAEDLSTDVPLNTYPTRDDFVAALTTFGSLVHEVDLLAEFSEGDQALLLYDMHTDPFGTIRIAEHFTVADGLIRRIRHVHDTVALRGVG